MQEREIKAKVTTGPQAGVPYGVTVSWPEGLQEAVDSWGDEAVFSRATAAFVIDIQAFMRSEIQAEDFEEAQLQERCASWKPGTRARGKSRAEKIENMLGQLTDEERSALLQRYLDSDE